MLNIFSLFDGLSSDQRMYNRNERRRYDSIDRGYKSLDRANKYDSRSTAYENGIDPFASMWAGISNVSDNVTRIWRPQTQTVIGKNGQSTSSANTNSLSVKTLAIVAVIGFFLFGRK